MARAAVCLLKYTKGSFRAKIAEIYEGQLPGQCCWNISRAASGQTLLSGQLQGQHFCQGSFRANIAVCLLRSEARSLAQEEREVMVQGNVSMRRSQNFNWDCIHWWDLRKLQVLLGNIPLVIIYMNELIVHTLRSPHWALLIFSVHSLSQTESNSTSCHLGVEE